MKFAEIIRNAGICPCEFPHTSNIEIRLYDGKDRVYSQEKIDFAEELFEHNKGSFRNFRIFLDGLENEFIESMNVKVDTASVVLFYKTHRALIFMRVPTSNPLDCME